MNQATHHRGPDGTGYFVDEAVSLGHNLLAITETAANSAQPVVSGDKNFVLLYNGEIYNYRKLRDELQKKGDLFKTDSDTEVLFAGLKRHGAAFLEVLDGMYAIAFYDRDNGRILLARDTSGMKPVYWSVGSKGLIFSSELRGIFTAGVNRRLNHATVPLYLALGYVPGSATLISSVSKLCPGQCIEYSINSGILKTGWSGSWRNRDLPEISEDELLGEIRRTIGDSARAHTMGLRPFGLYLSGGLDSGILFHELAGLKFKTFTTRFDVPADLDNAFNEDADIAARLCLDYGVEHEELLVNGNDYADAYVAAIDSIEEPRWNLGIGAYWLLAQKASKDIVVVLNGSGGDELFLGYPKYLESERITERYNRYSKFIVDLWYTMSALYKKRIPLGKFLHLADPVERWAYMSRISDVGAISVIIAALKGTDYPAKLDPLEDPENALAEFDRILWLADEEYIRTDKISMHFGMEGRFPMMSREIVRLANSIPSSLKLHNGVKKHLLREAYRGKLPEYVVNKKKTGWKAPAGYWMRGRFGELIRTVLSAEYYLGISDVVDMDLIRRNFDAAAGDFSTWKMKSFLPIAALQIWAKNFGITI